MNFLKKYIETMQFLEILNVGSNNKVLCAKHIYNFYPIETFVILKKKMKTLEDSKSIFIT